MPYGPCRRAQSWSPTANTSFDYRAFPTMLVRVYPDYGLADLLWAFAAFEELFAEQHRYALVIDASGVDRTPNPLERRVITQWERLHLTDTARWNVGTAIVFTSTLVRGSLSALNWFRAPVTPMHYAGDRQDALQWCAERLLCEGVTMQRAPDAPGATAAHAVK